MHKVFTILAGLVAHVKGERGAPNCEAGFEPNAAKTACEACDVDKATSYSSGCKVATCAGIYVPNLSGDECVECASSSDCDLGLTCMPDNTCAAVACSAEWHAATCSTGGYKFETGEELRTAVRQLYGGYMDGLPDPNATRIYGPINSWDVSNLDGRDEDGETTLDLFEYAPTFNDDIGCWNTSSFTSFNDLFYGAAAFNRSIGCWNTAKVTTMAGMFYQEASSGNAFNQDISAWDTAKVQTMDYMFEGATAFDQDIKRWDVSKVVTMSLMFYGATSFNQNLSLWETPQAMDSCGCYDFAADSGCQGTPPCGVEFKNPIVCEDCG